MKTITVNDAMLKVAKEVAQRYDYIEVDECSSFDLMKSSFWGDVAVALAAEEHGKSHVLKVCKYILPAFEREEGEIMRGCNGRAYASIDSYFGKPRLNVSLPDKTFVAITYTNGICSDVQAFGERGIQLAASLKFRLDELVNSPYQPAE